MIKAGSVFWKKGREKGQSDEPSKIAKMIMNPEASEDASILTQEGYFKFEDEETGFNLDTEPATKVAPKSERGK